MKRKCSTCAWEKKNPFGGNTMETIDAHNPLRSHIHEKGTWEGRRDGDNTSAMVDLWTKINNKVTIYQGGAKISHQPRTHLNFLFHTVAKFQFSMIGNMYAPFTYKWYRTTCTFHFWKSICNNLMGSMVQNHLNYLCHWNCESISS